MSNNKPTNEQIAHDFAVRLSLEECQVDVNGKSSDSYINSLVQEYNRFYDKLLASLECTQ